MQKILLYAILCAMVLIVVPPAASSPKLIVIIAIDQLRYDYLVRFKDHLGLEGFRFLMDNGASFSNATFKHGTNSTGPGHAVIATGAYANQNGIIANSWYDVLRQEGVYCVSDTRVALVGSDHEGRSPANLIGSSFGDELRLGSNFHSKVISVSIKDRSAILLGGKLANAAYWFADSAFVTSTYYAKDLPQWVKQFNGSGLIQSYFGKKWERVLPEEDYAVMGPDDAPYEDTPSGLGRTFPHPITGDDPSRITSSYYSALRTTPFGNDILAAFAREALREEKLGVDDYPDLFCISFSANDEVGHAYGPNSHEVLDITVRTDRTLADLLGFIEQEVGLKNCIIALTADHGVAAIPEYILSHAPQTDAGRVSHSALRSFCNAALSRTFGMLKKGGWIKRIVGNGIYLDRETVREKKLEAAAVVSVLADSLRTMTKIAAAQTRAELMGHFPPSSIAHKMQRSFHPQRSGDIMFALKPFYILDDGTTGTTHGQPYEYDAHVPLILFGEGIRSGTHATDASPADIAPTLSALLGVEFPAGREGRVLTEALKLP